MNDQTDFDDKYSRKVFELLGDEDIGSLKEAARALEDGTIASDLDSASEELRSKNLILTVNSYGTYLTHLGAEVYKEMFDEEPSNYRPKEAYPGALYYD
jgi:hypothetical protein